MFGPGDIDAAQGNAAVVVYVKKTATSQDTLTLTKADTSGRFIYQYVGAGYWERATSVGDGSIRGSVDAFVYGVTTPDASLPRSGAARYDVDMLGVRTDIGKLTAMVGDGTFTIDFALGAFAASGTMAEEGGALISFVADGRLSSTANSYTGRVSIQSPTVRYTGTINGQFFGPSATEVGGAWSASDGSITGSGEVVAGTITGRRNDQAAAASFSTQTSTTIFKGTGFRTQISATAPSRSIATVSISRNPADNTYSWTVPEASGTFPSTDIINNSYLGGSDYHVTAANDYVQGAEWLRITPGTPTVSKIDSVVFGFQTPDAELVRTGTASYRLDLFGTSFAESERAIFGVGKLNVDLGSGTVSYKGSFYPENQPDRLGGAFSGAGTLSSTTNSISGSISINYTQDRSTGAITGAFYGPKGVELGLAFSAKGAGGQFTGTILGVKDSSLSGGQDPLSAYATPSTWSYGVISDLGKAGLGGAARNSIFDLDPVTAKLAITWNPVKSTYSILTTTIEYSVDPVRYTFTGAEKIAAESNARFDVYRITQGAVTNTLHVYKYGQNELPLSYASFARFAINDHSGAPASDPTSLLSDVDRRVFFLFGSETAATAMPRTGSANYRGLAYGTGAQTGSNNLRKLFDVIGTADLAANFATGAITTRLALSGQQVGTSQTVDFGSYDFTSKLTGVHFVGSGNSGGSTGTIDGRFYGPSANEVGANWLIQQPLSSGARYDLAGVLLGQTVP
ncbi:transferrin-binding protein-like solute binding protein [Novosphingobium subterraneum]|uniref:transferrin-binding protein-like solute binding protein n=1 Tax=Novosphingobium subterraneum TaxID=48936 RepID=UPI003CFDCBB6